MLIRQKVVLHLINQAGGRISRIQLVKWAFLLVQTSPSPKLQTFYQFIPYRYGPFSFTLYHEVDTLIRKGYLKAPSEHTIQLASDSAIPPLDDALKHEIEAFSNKHSKLPEKKLLNIVYTRYPWFTINAVHLNRRMAKPPRAKCAVYTAGYERLQVDGFLNMLLRAGIRQVIDVRSNPVSRRYGFHKSTLSRLCQRLGLEYEHVPEVGISSELRAGVQRSSAYERLFRRYEQEVLKPQQDVVKMIADWVRRQPSVLVCVEATPSFCHRSCLARQIAYHTGLTVRNLTGKACQTSIPRHES